MKKIKLEKKDKIYILIMSASCLLSCFVGFINWTNSTKAEKKPLEE